MFNKIISCFLVLLILLLQVGCATFSQIPREELTNNYTDKGRYPSIIIRSSEITYKIPHDTYYIDSDTIYFELRVAEIQWNKKYPVTDKMALQDIKSVKVAATDPLLGLSIWVVGFVALIGALLLIWTGVATLSN